LACTVEAAHHGAFTDPEGSCCFFVREACDVDSNENIAKIGGKLGDRGIELARLEGRVRLERFGICDEIQLLGERVGTRAPALGTLLVQERVAKCPEEIAEVVLVAKQPGTSEHPRVRVLHKVLGVLAGARERPSGPIEPVEVISKPRGIERALHRVQVLTSTVPRSRVEPQLARVSEDCCDDSRRATTAVPDGARTVRITEGRGRLRVQIVAGSASERVRDSLTKTVRHMFRLDEDLSAFYELVREDSELS